MAARTITMDELGAAVREYAARHDLTMSSNEKGYCLMPGDVVIALQDGKPSCSNAEILDSLIEILMDLAEEPARAPQKPNLPARQTNTPSTRRSANGGQMVKSGAVLTVEDVLDYLCPGASEKEAMIAVNVCKARGMDPWSGDVHFIKYGNSPLTIVAGKEHFTKKAEANLQFNGFSAGIIVKGKDGYQELEGTFYTDEELVGGWARVWRKDRKEPFVQKVRLSAFTTGKAMWAKMPEVMVRKCALVNALREAFPGDLGGVYDSSEICQAVDVDFENVESP